MPRSHQERGKRESKGNQTEISCHTIENLKKMLDMEKHRPSDLAPIIFTLSTVYILFGIL